MQAIAAHSKNGLVIVQVERIVEKGTLHPRLVHLPAALVDKVQGLHGHFPGFRNPLEVLEPVSEMCSDLTHCKI